ncbi:MAG TPA: hypothetical protein VKG38_12155 [Solirubrobacteraceae bacterium]|nr:hypothetical protein [Solirubrobacteraceae bacterium]
MARILIVGGGCRGRRLASEMTGEGHSVRATTRTQAHRALIEESGAECWIGTPDRLATLRGALENVTIACWLLGSATGTPQQIADLHGSRLRFFLGEVIDTTVRGFVYEAAGTVAAEILDAGAEIVRGTGERNAIPTALLSADPNDLAAWLEQARATVHSLLEGR